MSLVLEVEFLTGACRAARSPASEVPDWPPQPDRVFSALVCAWAVRGGRRDERQALEWLEAQPPPAVHASGHAARTAPDVFVPPNDLKFSKTAKTYIKVMPDARPRQPRRFPVARPHDPVMAIVWPEAPGPDLRESLHGVARDVAYLGHSTSLVRCRFLPGDSVTLPHPGTPARRTVYPGRLAELEAAYRANPVRPVIRPGTSASRAPATSTGEPSAEWLVLEAIEGQTPDLRASALVCRALRRALMSGYRRADMGDVIPEIVSGHTADRSPTRLPHLAIVPLAFAGYPHADGRVFGLALVPPAGTDLRAIPGFVRAFEEVAPYEPGRERRVLKLEGASFGKPLHLAPAGATTIRSLSPAPYTESGAGVGERHADRARPASETERRPGDPRDHRRRLRERRLAASRSGSHSGREALRHRRCAAGAAAGWRAGLDRLEDARIARHTLAGSCGRRFRMRHGGSGTAGRRPVRRSWAVPSPGELIVDLVAADFAIFFRAIHGCPPFPWQQRLVDLLAEGDEWPDVLDLPTGSGKTAALDAAVFHMALRFECPARAALRIALVVDRRLVVDDAHKRATKIEKALDGAARAAEAECGVPAPLRARGRGGPSPATSGRRWRAAARRESTSRRRATGVRLGADADAADNSLLDRRSGGFAAVVSGLRRVRSHEAGSRRTVRPAQPDSCWTRPICRNRFGRPSMPCRRLAGLRYGRSCSLRHRALNRSAPSD